MKIITFLFLICFSLAYSKPQKNAAPPAKDERFDDVEVLREELNELKTEVKELKSELQKNEKRVENLERLLASESENENQLKEDIDNLRKEEEHLQHLHDKAWEKMQQEIGTEPYADLVEYGCVSDVIDLRCPANTTLFVTRAQYGQYGSTCSERCCPPNLSSDCLSNVDDNDNEAWSEIRLFCNYQTSCLYQYQGAQHPRCEALLADYLRISYGCLGDSTGVQQSIGFTIGHSTGSRYYYSGNRIAFAYNITNIGGHFITGSNYFVCPVDGLYYFSVNIISNTRIFARIVKNSEALVDIQTYQYGNSWDTTDQPFISASNSVVTRCYPGQQIWVVSTDYWYFYGGDPLDSTFSGFLISEF